MSKMTYDTRTMANSSGLGGEDPAVEFQTVKNPLPTDILCGKNKICIKHEGSKSFRRIIESYTQKYQDAASRNEKMEVTKEIFDRLQSRRFLKYNEETDLWETLHPLAVRDKIGHALRFSNRKGNTTIRKQVVRHSASDMAALQSGDIDTIRRSAMSMGCMDGMGLRKSHSKQALNKLRASTGSARPRMPSSTSNQDILTALPSFRSLHIGSGMTKNDQDAHGNQNAVFPSRNNGSSRVTPSNRFQTVNQDMIASLPPSFGNLDISGMNNGNHNAVFPSRPTSSNNNNSSSNHNRLAGNKVNVFQNAGHDMVSDLSTLNSLAIANSIELKTIDTSAPLSVNNQASAPSGPMAPSIASAPSVPSGDHLDDLSWMLQMPLMDMDGEGQVYFVNGQPQQRPPQQPQLQQFSV